MAYPIRGIDVDSRIMRSSPIRDRMALIGSRH